MSKNVPLYRALKKEEQQQITEMGYFGQEFVNPQQKEALYHGIDSYLRIGKNKNLYATTYDFSTALKYAKPSVMIAYHQGRQTYEVQNVKIHRSNIAVFNYAEIEFENILKISELTEKANKKLGNHAQGIADASKIEVIAGKIDSKSIYLLDKFHQDLLFCCDDILSENSSFFIKVLNALINKDTQEQINTYIINSDGFTSVERLIYKLFYCENLNLYEVVAPLYYSNEKADIYCVYDAIFEILSTILVKIYDYIFNHSINNNIIFTRLTKIYNTELNVLCIRNLSDKDEYINNIDFNVLFHENNLSTSDIEDCIWNIKLGKSIQKPSCDIDTSPLFLYLPKSPHPGLKHIPLSYEHRDYYFQENQCKDIFKHAKYMRPDRNYSYNLRVNMASKIIGDAYMNRMWSDGKSTNDIYGIYFDVALFYSELYIPPNYTSLPSKFFSMNYIDENYFNFNDWKPKGSEKYITDLNKKEYYSLRKEYFFRHIRLIPSYVDRVVKIFGGKNLAENNFFEFLDERSKNRSCKEDIIFNIENTVKQI